MKIRGDEMVSQDQRYQAFINDFSTCMYNLPKEQTYSDYIFLCVGSDKIIGDSYGPLVGEKLEERLKNRYQNIKIFGTLENPVLATNLNQTIEKINKEYKNPCIIAIDSALSQKDIIGSVLVSNAKMQCGKGTNKKMNLVGDISIKGVVAKDYRMPKYNFSSLQNTPLGSVLKLADITAEGIYNAIKYN